MFEDTKGETRVVDRSRKCNTKCQ